MMGFNASLKTYRFVFDDPDDQYCGLFFRARSLSVGEFRDFTTKLSDLGDLKDVKNPTTQQIERALSLFDLFGPYLIEWNLEQEGSDGEMVPVSPDSEGLRKIDQELALFIIFCWMEKVVNVAGPLGANSSSGATSAVASLPMESLSRSRAS